MNSLLVPLLVPRAGFTERTYLLALSFCCCILFVAGPMEAAITSGGNINPLPPAAGGNVAGPLRVGIVDVGTMDISGGTSLTSTNAAILGDTVTGLGIVTMNGFGSDWTLTTAGADLTVANNGTGSLNLTNLAFLSVNDDLFVAAQLNSLGEISISGLGTIVDVGDDANIAVRGQASVVVSGGGRLVTDANVIGDEAAGDGRVAVTDQFSLWRAFSTITIADAGRALLQVLDGARVENTTGIIGNLAGSTGTVEVDGLGSLWQNSASLIVADLGHGTLLITGGGRVTTGGGANLMTIGRQSSALGQVEVSGLDSLLAVNNFEIGDSGAGSLRVLDGGRVTSGPTILGDAETAHGEALVDGAGTSWHVGGDLTISVLGEGHLTISGGARVGSTAIVRVGALGQITFDGGRLDIGGATGLLNSGILEGNGAINSLVVNGPGGQIRAHDARPLVIASTLNNEGLVDVQSGSLEVRGSTTNESDIAARDGAVLRFAGGLDNNSGSQLAITTGIVDVFGPVDNNAGAEIVVGGSAVAVFHDELTSNGDVVVQPGGELLALDDLDLAAAAALTIRLQNVDLSKPGNISTDRFGQLQVAGAAALAGTLRVDLLGSFVPAAGDNFEILTAGGGRTGMFSTEILPTLPGGLGWDVQYNPNSVVLAVIGSGLMGDYNQNGVVDAADYVLWRNTLGDMGAGLPADGNGNGIIDSGDYGVWRAHYANTAKVSPPFAGLANVPEPPTMVFFVLGVLVLRRGVAR